MQNYGYDGRCVYLVNCPRYGQKQRRFMTNEPRTSSGTHTRSWLNHEGVQK